jgi:dolichyl-phosphate-mannose-protein mannosyltransferase
MERESTGPTVPTERRELVGLAGLAVVLVVAVAARWLAVGMEGHNGDVLVIHRWAERMAEVGPWGFYPGWISVYPALLYLYWPMGLLLDGEALDLAIKASSIPFDLAIGLVLWLIVRRWASPGAAVGAAALYLLNPAVLIAGPLWGQIDAAGTLLFLLALMATASRRWATAGALAMLAGMTKPQFGLVIIPVVFVALWLWRTPAGIRPLAWTAMGALAVYVLLGAPLLLDPVRYADQLLQNAGTRPFVSLFALNPWGLLVGFEVPDGWLAVVGAILLVIGLLAATIPLWRRQDLGALLVAGTLIVFAFYFLPTRAHERYLFPAMALLAPFAVLSLRGLAAYLVLSAAFAASLLHALTYINSAAVPEALLGVLRTTPSVWVMGLVLIGAACAEVWLLARDMTAERAAQRADDPRMRRWP